MKIKIKRRGITIDTKGPCGGTRRYIGFGRNPHGMAPKRLTTWADLPKGGFGVDTWMIGPFNYMRCGYGLAPRFRRKAAI